MAGGLVALLDDIAALARMAAASMDDVAAATGKASAKTVGVIVDDTAVTPQYLQGLKPERELPIIRRIARGSLINKLLVILPIALLLSQVAPWALPVILLVGGTYLAYEGMEKIWEKVHGGSHKTKPSITEGKGAEDAVVKSAVRTDLILSAEIMIIALNEVASEGLVARSVILVAVGFFVTFLVYAVVALLVKIDDLGVALMKRQQQFSQKLGAKLVAAMPRILTAIGVIGTAAMLWVGGHIIIASTYELGIAWPHDLVHLATGLVDSLGTMSGFLKWLIDTTLSLLAGMLIGTIVVLTVTAVKTTTKADGGK